jgi:hypothetical protein
MAAGTWRDTSLSTVASRSSFSLAARFTAVGCRLLVMAAATGWTDCPGAVRSSAAFCSAAFNAAFIPAIRADSCRTWRSYNPPARLPAASKHPRAQLAAMRQVCRAVFTTVRGRQYAASLQAFTLALKCSNAPVTNGSSISPANLSLPLIVFLSAPRELCQRPVTGALLPCPRSIPLLAQSRSTPALPHSEARTPSAGARSSPLQPSKPALPVLAPVSAAPRFVRRSAATRWPRLPPRRSLAYAARTAGAGCASGPSAN